MLDDGVEKETAASGLRVASLAASSALANAAKNVDKAAAAAPGEPRRGAAADPANAQAEAEAEVWPAADCARGAPFCGSTNEAASRAKRGRSALLRVRAVLPALYVL